jgi:hypothetical protein
MPAPMNLVAKPTRLVMYSPRCSYCGADTQDKNDGSARAGPRQSVLACTAHADLAKRDARAYMHKNGTMCRWDVIQDDPLFEALGFTGERICSPGVPLKNLTVKRTSGALEPGWWFRNFSSVFEPLDLAKRDGRWHIPAEGPGEVTKGIRVEEITLSLPEDKHHLVTAFIARLDTIYKADADAHDAAVAAGAKPETPATHPHIHMAYSEAYGRFGRVFEMPAAV